jgi:hypothetical protein
MVECDAIVDAILAFGIIFVAIFVFTFGNSMTALFTPGYLLAHFCWHVLSCHVMAINLSAISLNQLLLHLKVVQSEGLIFYLPLLLLAIAWIGKNIYVFKCIILLNLLFIRLICLPGVV